MINAFGALSEAKGTDIKMKSIKSLATFNKNIYISAVLLTLVLIFSIFIGGCGSSKTASDIQQSGRGASDSASPAQNEEAGTPGNAGKLDRKIAQKADLQMRVQDVTTVADEIINLCSQNGGYTVNSHIYRVKDNVMAQLEIKVPQANLLPVITSVSAYGEVTDKVIAVEDVTEEYYDSQARLKVLKAKEERLLGLMDRANSITEIISVENELSKTRSEIEVLSGRM